MSRGITRQENTEEDELIANIGNVDPAPKRVIPPGVRWKPAKGSGRRSKSEK